MPNPKRYQRNELLDKAVEIFRKQGFSGTSATDLTKGMGINPKSMYAEFGSKQGLFDAALEHYHSEHLSRVLANLTTEDATIEDIKTSFQHYANATKGRFRGLGCLMCNTAVERAALDPDSAVHVDHYFDRFTRAFEAALIRSRDEGAMADNVNIPDVAGYLTTCMVGISACIRANAPVEQIQATTNMVHRTLDSLAA